MNLIFQPINLLLISQVPFVKAMDGVEIFNLPWL